MPQLLLLPLFSPLDLESSPSRRLEVCQFGYVELAILNMWLLNGSNQVKFMCCPKPYALNPKGDGIKIIC
jgi:hypothetical protein